MRIFGLIGYPLEHSFSASYFAGKFKNEGIGDAEYRNFPLENISILPDLVNREKELLGLNITIPYKEKVLDFIHEVDKTAMEIGAANTLKINRSPSGEVNLKAFNTDAWGFLSSLREFSLRNVTKALVLGSGGASKAVIYSLESIGIHPFIVSRNPVSADYNYEELNRQIIEDHLLIVNTTPLGTFPNISEAPLIPYQFLTPQHIVHDLVYNPSETLFMKKAKEKGASVKNGFQMLVEQAEKSWDIWNNEKL